MSTALASMSTALASTPLLADEGWRYAAWVAIDLRLCLFAFILAALTAAGVASLLVRSTRWHDYLTVWLLAFFTLFVVTVFFMNEVAQEPVFVVEALFAFP